MTARPAAAGDRSGALRADLAEAVRTLAAAGIESPRADAEQLAAFVLGVPRGRLVMSDWALGQREKFQSLVARRAAREPLQHIIGTVGFRRLELHVGPGVFVPRPESEVVAGWAIDALHAMGGRPVVVDLCTGSGTLALAIADEVPAAVVHAVEREPEALRWARRNVETTGLPVTLHHGDVTGDLGGALPELAGRVDVVVSNPPYVADHEQVEPEVGEHDPPVALWAGTDGLELVRAVAAAASRLLRPGGLVVVEHSDRQGSSAPAVFAGWEDVADHRDLAHRDRFVTARLPGGAPQDVRMSR